VAEEHETHIKLTLKDKVSEAAHKASESVERLGDRAEKTLSKLTEMGMALSGMAGAFGLERMVETGKESLEQVGKLSKLTDMTADHVAAMRDVFEQSGLGAEQMSRSMTMLSKKALALEENGKAISDEARRWGIDLKNGPEAALLSISEAVKKHKIGQAEVMKLTGVTRENLGGMMELLEGGREELKRNVDEAAKLNVHLADPGVLERFKKFHEASEKIREAWRRVSEKVVIGLAPALSRMSDKFSHWIDHLNVDKFVNTLVKGLEMAVAHAKQLGRVMMINMALERTMGSGIVGSASRAWGMAGHMPGVGALGRGAGGAVKLAAGVGEGVFGGLGKIFAPIAKLFSMAGSLGPVVSGLVQFATKATVILAIVSAVAMLAQHSEKLKAAVGKLWEAVKKVGDALLGVFNTEAVQWLGEKLIWVATKLAEAVTKLLNGLAIILGGPDKWKGAITGVGTERGRQAAMDRAVNDFVKEWQANLAKMSDAELAIASKGLGPLAQFYKRGVDITDMSDTLVEMQNSIPRLKELRDQEYAIEATAINAKERQLEQQEAFAKWGKETLGDLVQWGQKWLGPKATPDKPLFNQDFRGSRFEIEQKFAEGFDPDRIAVAFANDISSLGERKMTSTLGPQFIR
jgi:hypothetical protein